MLRQMEQLLGDSVLVRLYEVDVNPRAVGSFAESNIHQTGLILILTTHPSLELKHRTAMGAVCTSVSSCTSSFLIQHRKLPTSRTEPRSIFPKWAVATGIKEASHWTTGLECDWCLACTAVQSPVETLTYLCQTVLQSSTFNIYVCPHQSAVLPAYHRLAARHL